MKEFLHGEWSLVALSNGGSQSLTLTRNDLVNQQVAILISGVSKASVGNVINIITRAGSTSLDLAKASDLITDVSGSPAGCLVQINFPVQYLQIVATPSGTDLNITVIGGNK